MPGIELRLIEHLPRCAMTPAKALNVLMFNVQLPKTDKGKWRRGLWSFKQCRDLICKNEGTRAVFGSVPLCPQDGHSHQLSKRRVHFFNRHLWRCPIGFCLEYLPVKATERRTGGAFPSQLPWPDSGRHHQRPSMVPWPHSTWALWRVTQVTSPVPSAPSCQTFLRSLFSVSSGRLLYCWWTYSISACQFVSVKPQPSDLPVSIELLGFLKRCWL